MLRLGPFAILRCVCRPTCRGRAWTRIIRRTISAGPYLPRECVRTPVYAFPIAHHETPESMLCESLREFVKAAEWCIATNKPDAPEGSVYGYPAAVLLCAAIASIGSWVTSERTTAGQFAAALSLRHEDLFGLDIDRSTAEQVYERVRNRLSHNAILAKETVLVRGAPSGLPIVQEDGHAVVNWVRVSSRDVMPVGG
jgi:hypothetical protein